MARQETDDLLHKRTHHTNISLPRSDYVNGNKFPKQNTNLLGNKVVLKVKNMYITEAPDDWYYQSVDGKLRPEAYDEEENFNDYKSEYLVIRADAEEPYTMICVESDYSTVIVTDSRNYNNIVPRYPNQIRELIGLTVFDQYAGEIPEIRGVTIRVDAHEPCYSVIIEFLPDGYIRAVLGDECFTKLYDYYDENFTKRDYNGRDSRNHGFFVDADGKKTTEIKEGETYVDINAGPANIIHDYFTKQRSAEGIREMIKFILKGKKLYGSTV